MERGQSRSELKRAVILDAAKKIFLKQGFKQASVDAIATYANVSKKTIYHHFSNKETLFRSMLKAYWSAIFSVQPVIFKPNVTIEKNLACYSAVLFHFLYQADTINLLKMLISESNQFPDLLDDFLVNEKAPFTHALVMYLTEKKTSGELTIDQPKRAAAHFMGLLKEEHFWPMMLGFAKTMKPENPQALIDNAIAVFMAYYGVNPKG